MGRLLLIVILVSVIPAQSQNRPQPQPQQQADRASKSQYRAEAGFFSRLDFISPYCTRATGDEQNKWRKNFICEVKITDVVIAAFTAFLAVFTWLLVRVGGRQARLARDTLIVQRAFVFVRNVILAANLDPNTEEVKRWLASVEWENSGQTPTRNLRIMINSAVRAEVLPDGYDFPDFEFGEMPTLIGPHASIRSKELEITVEQLDEVKEETAHFYVWGWAEYDDVFPRTPRHRTEFCYKWTVGGDLGIPSRMTAKYTLHHEHNGADEECFKPVQTASMKR
jgi:hypothetical protein